MGLPAAFQYIYLTFSLCKSGERRLQTTGIGVFSGGGDKNINIGRQLRAPSYVSVTTFKLYNSQQ